MKAALLPMLLISFASADLRQPASPSLVHVSERAGNHRIVSRIQPVCPADACSLCANAVTKLQVLVGRSGNVKNIVVLQGPSRLEDAAMSAVRQWRYEPYLVAGQPVEYETRTMITSWTCRN